jgi:hypothetical protein
MTNCPVNDKPDFMSGKGQIGVHKQNEPDLVCPG